MTDVLEQKLREALTEQAAQIDHGASARLRAIDYRPRRLRIPARPAIGLTGLAGATAAVAAVIAFGSGAAPAFAGWRANPTAPLPGQLAQAQQACGSGTGTPVLTDTRGPYTAALYAQPNGGQLCVSGDGALASAQWSSMNGGSVPAGNVQLDGNGLRDAGGDALTLVYGRIGSGVTAVTVERSDGSSVQATVTNGWYLAWWPGSAGATTAEVTTASGTSTQTFPSAPATPSCPSGGNCQFGYAFGGPGTARQGSASGGGTIVSRGGSVSTTAQPPAATGNSGSTTGNSGSTTGNSGSTTGNSGS